MASDDDGLAELTLLATVANLQVNLEILEVSRQILASHQQEIEELRNERTIRNNSKDVMHVTKGSG